MIGAVAEMNLDAFFVGYRVDGRAGASDPVHRSPSGRDRWLVGEVLSLCARQGLVSVGVIAVDGTKVAGTASRNANMDYEQIARAILEKPGGRCRRGRALRRGARDELPEQLRTGEGRRAWLPQAKRQLEEQRAREARPVAHNRGKRLKEAKRRLDEELLTEMRADAAYERYRSGRMRDARRFSRPPDPLAFRGSA